MIRSMLNKFKAPDSQKSSEFYDKMMAGEEKRGVLGKDQRFNAIRVASLSSVKKYFYENVKPYISKTDKVLDFGCGPGSFMISIAPLCSEIIGVDISNAFIQEANAHFETAGLKNAKAVHTAPGKLPFEDESFDKVLLVDVLHHLDNPSSILPEVVRVLKKGGRLIVYEPNLINPLLFAMHAIDPNERGLLRLGTIPRYKNLLNTFFSIDFADYNGIVIGPESKLFLAVADFLNSQWIKPVLGWLNPKVFLTGLKKA